MSVDTIIRFNDGAEIGSIAIAIALLYGCEKKWQTDDGEEYDSPQEKGWVSVKNLKIENTELVLLAKIAILRPGRIQTDSFRYHGEERLIMLKAYGESICLFRRLCEIFGGKVDYRDNDDINIDFQATSPIWHHHNKSDFHWHALQLALWNIKPMTREEIEKFVEISPYKR